MKSIGTVQLYTPLLKEILNALITNSSASIEAKEISAQDEEFSGLMETMSSSVQQVKEFFRVLLTHEDIQKYFLASLVKHANENPKIRKELSHLLSSEVAALISFAPKDSFTSETAVHFKEKILESICYPAHGGKHSIILSCIAAFCKHFTSEEIARCLRFLLHLSRDTLIENKQLTNHGKLIVTLMRALVEEKSEMFLPRCPIDVLRNVVKLLQETNNPGPYFAIFLCFDVDSVGWSVFMSCCEKIPSSVSDLEQLYIQVLERSSVCSIAASEELLHASLRNLTDQSLKVCSYHSVYNLGVKLWQKWQL